jgi:group I intron endonuclease
MDIGHIYKITSPIGKIYVGQSINIKLRFKKYDKLQCKSQTKLYNSFIKYGVDKHLFEVIKECNICELNKWERYYQDHYKELGIELLNLKTTTTNSKSGHLSDETKQKIGTSNKIMQNRPENKEKVRLRHSGKKLSQETKNKIKIKLKLIYYPKKYRSILQYSLYGDFIKEWSSINEASEYYKICSTGITNCLKGRSKTCNKYKWKYKNK